MTDPDLVAKKLALIETCVADIRRIGRPDRIETDIREERFIEHTLQMAIQAALDASSHIVSDQRLGEPRSNAELFALLASAGWIAPDRLPILERMAGFRNILVHGYQKVNPSIVRDIVENHLDDLLDFAAAIRSSLPES